MPSLARRDFLGLGSALAAAVAAPAEATQSGDAPQPAVTSAPAVHAIRMELNGRPIELAVEARVTLLDLLRERFDLTGAKKGCNEGACGACTVLIDGKRVNACLTLAVQCADRSVVTVEGIAAADGSLHPVQAAFIEHDAFQCGYCTSGQIISAVALISEGHATDEATVREWMSGNLCRCSAYPQITAAVLDAAARLRED